MACRNIYIFLLFRFIFWDLLIERKPEFTFKKSFFHFYVCVWVWVNLFLFFCVNNLPFHLISSLLFFNFNDTNQKLLLTKYIYLFTNLFWCYGKVSNVYVFLLIILIIKKSFTANSKLQIGVSQKTLMTHDESNSPQTNFKLL